jgi:hypothetical protein
MYRLCGGEVPRIFYVVVNFSLGEEEVMKGGNG